MILSIAARLIKELDIVALEIIQVIIRRTFIGDHAFNFFPNDAKLLKAVTLNFV